VNDNSLPSTTEMLDYNWFTMAVKDNSVWTHSARECDSSMRRCGEGRLCVSAEEMVDEVESVYDAPTPHEGESSSVHAL